MDDRRKAEAIAAARREIARRIARFCTSLSHDDFEKLLDRMARIHWKYDVHPNVVEPELVGTEEPDLAEQPEAAKYRTARS
ncbi:MAG: hypothetical protein ACJ78M_06030 [Gemmatimonadaceae bacterium]